MIIIKEKNLETILDIIYNISDLVNKEDIIIINNKELEENTIKECFYDILGNHYKEDVKFDGYKIKSISGCNVVGVDYKI